MIDFEWDESKNERNRRKHGVSFNQAKETFSDPNAVSYRSHSETEVRFIRVGKTAAKVLLSVIYTFRKTVVRIISARTPRKTEIREYLEHSLSKKSDHE